MCQNLVDGSSGTGGSDKLSLAVSFPSTCRQPSLKDLNLMSLPVGSMRTKGCPPPPRFSEVTKPQNSRLGSRMACEERVTAESLTSSRLLVSTFCTSVRVAGTSSALLQLACRVTDAWLYSCPAAAAAARADSLASRDRWIYNKSLVSFSRTRSHTSLSCYVALPASTCARLQLLYPLLTPMVRPHWDWLAMVSLSPHLPPR